MMIPDPNDHSSAVMPAPSSRRRRALGWALLLVWLAGATSWGATITLLPAGAIWKFQDNGLDQGTAWIAPDFDDAGWMAGFAPLGYNADEETTVSYGPDINNRFITTYFRNTFVATGINSITDLTFNLQRDDGAVVYLNGVEVFRSNLPAGVITNTTLAVTNVTGTGETTFHSRTLPPDLLIEGNNVLAVEVHQSRNNSADLIFDLQLTATRFIPVVTRGPYLQQGSMTNIVVKWRTATPTDAAVHFGLTPANLDQLATDPTVTTNHEVRLTDLLPNTRYFYSIGTSQLPLAGDETYFFVTAPEGAKPTRIWAVGDPGTANINQRAVRDAYYALAGTNYTDLWLRLGDIAYSIGLDSEYQAAQFNMYPTLMRQTVVWPTIGNHDYYTHIGPDNFPYMDIFSLPKNGEVGGVPSGTEKYYSFNYGNIHFVCMDSMSSDRLPTGPMLTWLKSDLEANTNDWLIAFWHHPPYSKGSHNSDAEIELIQMRQYVLPILESHGVDLVLCGHSHSYERSFLLNGHYGYSTSLTPAMIKNAGAGRRDWSGPYTKASLGPTPNQGTVYVVAGSGGQGPSGGTHDHPAMFISLNVLGSVVLDINGNTLEARFLRENGAIDDYFTILKGVPPGTGEPGAPRIVSLSFAGQVVTLTWAAAPGRKYYVEFATQLDAAGRGDWFQISNTQTAFATTASWTDFYSGLDLGFYRVVNCQTGCPD